MLPAPVVVASKVTPPSTNIPPGLGLSSDLEINSVHVSPMQCRRNLICSSPSVNRAENNQKQSVRSNTGKQPFHSNWTAGPFSYSARIIKNTK